jgi:CBS domain-containing protein
MSPRAAWRLESLGFTQVFDYVAGKQDWLTSGLPREGTSAKVPYIGDLARRDVPRCGLTDRVGDVLERVRAAGWDVCVVVNDPGVVLGLLRADASASDPRAAVELVMESGPSTFRPNVSLEAIVHDMREHGLDRALVTTSAGRLLGILPREDAERRLADPRLPGGKRDASA